MRGSWLAQTAILAMSGLDGGWQVSALRAYDGAAAMGSARWLAFQAAAYGGLNKAASLSNRFAAQSGFYQKMPQAVFMRLAGHYRAVGRMGAGCVVFCSWGNAKTA